MTQAERVLLPSLIDEVVALETVQGKRLLAQILVVFDEGETPDLFCVEVIRGTDGAWVQRRKPGTPSCSPRSRRWDLLLR